MRNDNRYPKDWAHLPSVTEVLEVLCPVGLQNWFKRMDYHSIKETVNKSQVIGTEVNQVVDLIEQGKPVEFSPKYPEEFKIAMQSFFDWRRSPEHQIKRVLGSQIAIKSDKYKYCGTLDRIVQLMDDRVILIDWKVNSGIKLSNKMQVAAYSYAWFPTNEIPVPHIDEAWVVRLGKKKVEHETCKIEEPLLGIYFNYFVSLLEIYKELEEENA